MNTHAVAFEQYLHLGEDVAQAFAAGRPIVALESTIITHGMPFPANVDTALAVEQVVRDHGAVPATIALLRGEIRVGMSPEEIRALGQASDTEKASRRDIPVHIAMGKTSGTTVSGTMICARLAGIDVFATGGIGGVHREGHQSLDISADLDELAQTSVLVVSAGAKSILDLPRTLEYLETKGVPVIGYGTDFFPSFFCRSSGLKIRARVDSPRKAAEVAAVKWDLGLRGGVLLANPVPEEWSLDGAEVEAIIQKALAQASEAQVSGAEMTPFLLSAIEKASGGKTLRTNVELVKNNAAVAAQIARELCELRKH